MIQFEKLQPCDKALYQPYLNHAAQRGCTYSFANLYLWGRQCAALVEGCMVLFSHFSGRSIYPFPSGQGDLRAALEALMADARERGIPFRLYGLSEADKALLQALYPDRFRFHCDRDSFDYVYDIHDLADLKGRKYQQKRNHIHRFEDSFSDWRAEPLTEENAQAALDFAEYWYDLRAQLDPEEDLQMERSALRRAFRHWQELGMEGLVLYADGKIVAMTMASFLSEDTLDVHFEKALPHIQGAYPTINREFARHIREKYPQVQYLNREDDMGMEGLRKAKLSYHPHHMVEKSWALMTVEGYDE